MDKNTLTGLALMALIWIGYALYSAPSEEELAAQEAARVAEQVRADSLAAATAAEKAVWAERQAEAAAPLDSAARAAVDAQTRMKFGPLAPAVVTAEATETVLKGGLLEVAFSSQGGLPIRATLRDGSTRYGSDEAISLWDPERSQMDLHFDLAAAGRVSASDLNFALVSATDTSAVLEARGDQGTALRWTHAIDGYELHSELSWIGLAGLASEQANLVWQAVGLANEKGLEWERQHSSIYFREADMGRDYLSDGREDEETVEGTLEWFAFKQNFFSALVALDGGFAPGAQLKSAPLEGDTTATMAYQAQVGVPLKFAAGNAASSFQFYFGPNEIDALNATELGEVDRIIDYGWWIFGWVNRNLILPLYNLLNHTIASAGLIILIITLVIKLVLSPITWKNFMSSAKMRVLKPEMDAINEQHKDDAMARQQAMMSLYRETGVNPLAGCLPALLQMPILYAMFRFFPANIDLRGKSFWWADDLGAYDSILDLPFSIPMYGAHVSGFTVLMAASTFFYMRLTMASQPQQPQQPGMPNMKVIQQIFPFMMLFFFNRYAAGLSLYYLTANVISIGQMYAIKAFFVDEEKIRAKIDAKKAQPKKKSSFQERLEQMQAEQQKRTKEIKQTRKGRK